MPKCYLPDLPDGDMVRVSAAAAELIDFAALPRSHHLLAAGSLSGFLYDALRLKRYDDIAATAKRFIHTGRDYDACLLQSMTLPTKVLQSKLHWITPLIVSRGVLAIWIGRSDSWSRSEIAGCLSEYGFQLEACQTIEQGMAFLACRAG